MKTPIYETSPGAGAALINSGAFVYVTLYSITLFGTQGVIRLTDADRDVAFGGHTWNSRGPQLDQRSTQALAHWKRGLDLDTWQVIISPRNVDPVTGEAYPDKIGSVPWIAACRGGALDGADVQVDRAYFAAFPPYALTMSPTAVYTIFAGRPAEVDTTDSAVVLTLNDYRELLSQQMPRNVWQASCRWTLYDAGCTLHQEDFAIGAVAAAGSTRGSVIAASIASPGGSGSYALGKIVMTGGLNAGFSRTVARFSGRTFGLLNPLPFNVQAGDSFKAYPGCDKQLTTCDLFANRVNFGGEPFVPDATTAA